MKFSVETWWSFKNTKYAKIYKLMGRKDDKVDHGVIHGLSRGAKPVIQPTRAKNIYKSSPF
jgi:hypothetical protein